MWLRQKQQSVLVLVSATGLCAALSLIVNTEPQARSPSPPPRQSSFRYGPCERDTNSGCSNHHSLMTRRHALDQRSVAAFLGVLLAITATFDPAIALTPKEAAIQYDAYAPTYDRLDGGQASTTLGIEEARAALVRQATGNVLEIGVGTGEFLVLHAFRLLTLCTTFSRFSLALFFASKDSIWINISAHKSRS